MLPFLKYRGIDFRFKSVTSPKKGNISLETFA